jgi:hypothetical protein
LSFPFGLPVGFPETPLGKRVFIGGLLYPISRTGLSLFSDIDDLPFTLFKGLAGRLVQSWLMPLLKRVKIKNPLSQ